MAEQMMEPKSVFMTKYYSDPDYKKKHIEYMMTSIICDCGKPILRCNMTKHKKSKNHTFIMKLYKSCTPAEIQKYLALQNEPEMNT